MNSEDPNSQEFPSHVGNALTQISSDEATPLDPNFFQDLEVPGFGTPNFQEEEIPPQVSTAIVGSSNLNPEENFQQLQGLANSPVRIFLPGQLQPNQVSSGNTGASNINPRHEFLSHVILPQSSGYEVSTLDPDFFQDLQIPGLGTFDFVQEEIQPQVTGAIVESSNLNTEENFQQQQSVANSPLQNFLVGQLQPNQVSRANTGASSINPSQEFPSHVENLLSQSSSDEVTPDYSDLQISGFGTFFPQEEIPPQVSSAIIGSSNLSREEKIHQLQGLASSPVPNFLPGQLQPNQVSSRDTGTANFNPENLEIPFRRQPENPTSAESSYELLLGMLEVWLNSVGESTTSRPPAGENPNTLEGSAPAVENEGAAVPAVAKKRPGRAPKPVKKFPAMAKGLSWFEPKIWSTKPEVKMFLGTSGNISERLMEETGNTHGHGFSRPELDRQKKAGESSSRGKGIVDEQPRPSQDHHANPDSEAVLTEYCDQEYERLTQMFDSVQNQLPVQDTDDGSGRGKGMVDEQQRPSQDNHANPESEAVLREQCNQENEGPTQMLDSVQNQFLLQDTGEKTFDPSTDLLSDWLDLPWDFDRFGYK